MKKVNKRKLLISLMAYVIISFGVTIIIKTNIGKPPFNIIPLAIHDILYLKLG